MVKVVEVQPPEPEVADPYAVAAGIDTCYLNRIGPARPPAAETVGRSRRVLRDLKVAYRAEVQALSVTARSDTSCLSNHSP